MITRDQRLMLLAFHVAEWSKDPSTKVGAVAVGKDPRDIALGYNGFPPGIADTPERLSDRPTKYALTQHAERNVLDNARFDLKGATLYCTAFPCSECAKSIVSKGIARVVTTPPPALDRSRPWTLSFGWTRDVLDEAKIKLDIMVEAAWEAGEHYQTQAEIVEQDARVRVAMEHARELKK